MNNLETDFKGTKKSNYAKSKKMRNISRREVTPFPKWENNFDNPHKHFEIEKTVHDEFSRIKAT